MSETELKPCPFCNGPAGLDTVHTTLNQIKSFGPCRDGWKKLLAGLGKTEADDAPLHMSEILRINGIEDAIWALRCFPLLHVAAEFARRAAYRAADYTRHSASSDARAAAAVAASAADYTRRSAAIDARAAAADAADWAATRAVNCAADVAAVAAELAAQEADLLELTGSMQLADEGNNKAEARVAELEQQIDAQARRVE